MACLQPCLHGDDWSDVMLSCVERRGSLFYCQKHPVRCQRCFQGSVVVLVNDLDGCCLPGEWLIRDLSQGGLIFCLAMLTHLFYILISDSTGPLEG